MERLFPGIFPAPPNPVFSVSPCSPWGPAENGLKAGLCGPRDSLGSPPLLRPPKRELENGLGLLSFLTSVNVSLLSPSPPVGRSCSSRLEELFVRAWGNSGILGILGGWGRKRLGLFGEDSDSSTGCLALMGSVVVGSELIGWCVWKAGVWKRWMIGKLATGVSLPVFRDVRRKVSLKQQRLYKAQHRPGRSSTTLTSPVWTRGRQSC